MKNIILAGVGGQGLVLATKIISEAGFRAGFDIKSNDVIGLSQRGGKVYGSIRIGDKVNSPNIPIGYGDILIGLEPLEAYRLENFLKPNGLVILNTYKVYPTSILMETCNYPDGIDEYFASNYELIKLDAVDKAIEIGNSKVSNTILIGILARHLEFMISKDTWIDVISDLVPKKAIDDNICAFNLGFNSISN